jgi:hypothetical protein
MTASNSVAFAGVVTLDQQPQATPCLLREINVSKVYEPTSRTPKRPILSFCSERVILSMASLMAVGRQMALHEAPNAASGGPRQRWRRMSTTFGAASAAVRSRAGGLVAAAAHAHVRFVRGQSCQGSCGGFSFSGKCIINKIKAILVLLLPPAHHRTIIPTTRSVTGARSRELDPGPV